MLPQTFSIDDVVVVVTYGGIDNERALDLELHAAGDAIALGTYRASSGLVLIAQALSASQRTSLASQCAAALAQWNAS